jgi:Tfp pilus assembly protein PilN
MKKTLALFHWLPRVLCVTAILFISLFALDAFDPELSLWQQLAAFLIHLIPSFVLGVILLVAWKWEYIGGFIFTVLGLGLSPWVYMMNYQMNHSIWMSMGVVLMITFPFVMVGILFVLSHFLKKKNTATNAIAE